MRCCTFSPRYVPLSLAVTVLILSGCAGGDAKDGKGGKDAGKDKAGAALTVVVADLTKEYKADAAAADKKYKDKTIEFEAVVFVPPDPGISMLLLKDPAAKEPSPDVVRCRVAAAHEGKMKGLKTDQKVKAKGLCVGKTDMFVDVLNVELLDVGPAPKE